MPGLTQIHLVVYSVAVFCIAALAHVSGDDTILQKRSERSRMDTDQFMDNRRGKRPFCNTFTGCGKKRSDESLSSLVELTSEPAVEELTKEILSEAKLWEAIQEARAELERRRSDREKLMERNIPLAFAMSGMGSKRSRLGPVDQKLANELEQYNRRR